ncbi:AMP deaminase 2 [Wickerhamomyces ciferrii]|uniref:AMP deaminase 2 n=1 Tax=Wickerhamomyces ciferrii (strain ATCC 14091 / BCRC 22168 / CBS 111 / JCM 3599 / NBRC 0793 / NRRL Y-1031 F-60-10) TaxID=1206466 RepID=K0KKM2_WICCF|nr:AMP deaminase 2 [Wickerhamomyces ciferrii]CCH41668.1 AMP deaminase 2 [Wickerhamomyces ciferrii]
MSLNDVVYDERSHRAQLSEKLKQNSINLIPIVDQLYELDDVSKVPISYKQITPDGDVIQMRTRFDYQASLGSFEVDELTKIMNSNTKLADHGNFEQLQQYSNEIRVFCKNLIECESLRDKYQIISSQRSCDNPLYDDSWKSYPPPQPKGWHFEDEFGAVNYFHGEGTEPHYSGEKFDLEHYKERVIKPYMSKLKPGESELKFGQGKHHLYEVEGVKHEAFPSFHDFLEDLNFIIDTSINKTGVMLSMRRLKYLKSKFESYILLNEQKEQSKTKLNPHRDFYNSRKVDNNIGLSMCMSKKHLLNVINLKLREETNRIVYENETTGEKLTLEQLFEPYFDTTKSKRLNVDDLFEFGLIDRNFDLSDGINIDNDTDYESIIKNETLSKIEKTFLRINNHINGEYLSVILKQVLTDYEKSKYQFGEIGINFNLLEKTNNKWEALADWVIDNKLVSYNVKWIIRIPRNYSVLKKAGLINSFQDFLDLIFNKLFEVSINPGSNPKLHFFLTKISAFDLLSVDKQHQDHSLFDVKELKSPRKWTNDTNPPYSYYLYYLFINFSSLNNFRKTRGLSTFNLRPHVASISDKSGLGVITESLATCFLLSKNIINGEKLCNYPVLQYLYYLKQIGITMSPLCWNKTLQLLNDDDNHIESNRFAYEKNPSIEFFQMGMKVSLSTNKPLFSSLTRDPLIEEYSIAGSIHKLSGVDLCELCRNSVLISEYNGGLKKHWIGIKYPKQVENDSYVDWEFTDDFGIQRCNVPNMRLDYRLDSLRLEHGFLKKFK